MAFEYDYHVHTTLSFCHEGDLTVDNLIKMARERGLEGFAVTDHSSHLYFDRPTVSRHEYLVNYDVFLEWREQGNRRFQEYLDMLNGYRDANVLTGAEVDVSANGGLIFDSQYRDCMDVLLGFSSWKVTHIYRDDNKKADKLANKAMDAKRDVVLKGKKPATGKKLLRIGVLLSGGGTTMVNIQKEIDAGSLNAKIVQVISSLSTVRGVDLAKGMQLPLEIVRRKDFSDVESFSDRIAEVMDAAKVDLIVQAGWLCLWRIPETYENKVMNIHPALLPSFGGKGMWGHHVHQAVLKAGCKVSGCTVHFVTNEYDTGPIIVQKGCAVKDDDDADTLAARVFQQECKAYPQAIKLFAEGKLKVKNGIVKIS